MLLPAWHNAFLLLNLQGKSFYGRLPLFFTIFVVMKQTRILFLCHGNICRSPMAEFVMKHLVRERGEEARYYIESAAVSDEEYGNPIYPPARRCLSLHGVEFDKSRTARRVTAGDYERFDRIICMDHSNLRWLNHILPADPQNKIRLMMSYTGQDRDVVDPWYPPCDFEQTYRDILAACTAMLDNPELFYSL